MSKELKNGRYEDKYGEVYWYKDGVMHREDGPAYEGCDFKEWYIMGELHREDGPAREWSNGGNEWYKDGKLHREDGPAIEYPDGDKEWWLSGVKYTEVEFNHWLSKKNLNEQLTKQLEVKPNEKKVKI